jgi:cell fate (sporulation/competence/biofilm development) regulator YlbF (YheA/YmcA/DUF963 family)
MHAYDKAHELAELLSQSEEYKEFKRAKISLEKDQDNLRLLQDFRRKQLEIQMAQLSGEEVDEEYIKQTEHLYELLSMNSKINEYLNAEYKFARMMADIQKIIGEAVSEWFAIELVNKNVN